VSSPVALLPPELILVRYGELALKKKNRPMFERALVRNIHEATRAVSPVEIERRSGRLAVVPERRAAEVARRVQDVFGIKSLSPAWGAPSEPDEIVALARAVLDDALRDVPAGRCVTFRVRTSRADKSFPMTSTELDRYVADRILPGPERVKVQLEGPELELGIDVRAERTYVFSKRLRGLGGLPVGTLGRVLCLLSGGIDSPVAAWMAMKRGCRVAFVTYHSYPFLGERSKKKVIDLVRVLTRFQPSARLFVVPFTDVQTTIRDAAPEAYRTVLYRRMMQRIASAIGARYDYQALVTGESMGQVASQTLENMTCIGAAADLPVLRPLVAFDKEETIEIARRIGTFEVSKRPEPDCCTVFQPKKPVVRGKLETCLAVESEIDVGGLVEAAVRGVEILDLTPE